MGGSIAGRGVVIHETFDHGAGEGCDAAGSSGTRYATCVIGVADDAIVIGNPTVTVDTNFEDVDCDAATTADTTADTTVDTNSFSTGGTPVTIFSPFTGSDQESRSFASSLQVSFLLLVIVLV